MTPISLAPLPPADGKNWIATPFAPCGLEAVEALRPARDEYKNPNAPALVLLPGLTAIPGEEKFGHFARHVEEYVIANKLQERPGGFVLGGCSMGGSLSLAICIRGRIKPRGLVLIGTFGNARHLPFHQRFLAPLSWILPLDFAKRMARKVVGVIKNPRSAFTRDLSYLATDHFHRTRGYYGRAIMALTRQNQIEDAKALRIPTLIVHGSRDWVLPHAAGEELARAIPGSKFVSIPDAGHILFYTHAEEVNAIIAEFLTGLKNT